MYKQEIINAIQNQSFLRITFRRQADDNWVTRDVAPYDVFQQMNKKNGFSQDLLQGYAKEDANHEPHVVSIYLENIQSMQELNENFDGREVKRLINPKYPPAIPRNW